ncbi:MULTISPECIES: hypothetical protein [Methanobacterium]|uniref:TIGR04086 family membrane protein n=1 Tax=Methanobacterium veterum TaxID=408577 RepID=A0A9E5A4X2_9EURY|nr:MULTISPECIES: hypothetical protein [Methanobacterium]MCZ3365440.1 hypothetical protein [Methanobacterium veterum]MCZ3373191.1 hypothetical protein [Methanobacterium veterum]
MRKFNPVISIISGIIVTITMAYVGFLIIDTPNFGILDIILLCFSLVIGGFISTYFTEKRRIVYGVCEGLILSIMCATYVVGTGKGLSYINYIAAYINVALGFVSATYIGSILGRKNRYMY